MSAVSVLADDCITTHTELVPRDWQPPSGHSNGVVATGAHVFVASQVGWSAEGQFPSDDFKAQVRFAPENVIAVLTQAGGHREHFVWLR